MHKSPSTWHDLCIDARDIQSRIQTCPVMGLCHLAAVSSLCAHRAVIGTLWCRESILRPSQWSTTGGVKQGVFLLDAVPRLLRLHLLLANTAAAAARLLVSRGFMVLPLSVSQRHSRLSPRRKGSGQNLTGLSTTSESWPSAWFVEEPSNSSQHTKYALGNYSSNGHELRNKDKTLLGDDTITLVAIPGEIGDSMVTL